MPLQKKHFYHALKIDKDICIGCTHCMRSCPTMSLRVKEGKAILIEERCVDCGYCLKVCPVGAISIEQDDFQEIMKYTHRIALIPAIFFAQFQPNVSVQLLYSLLHEIGFTDVFETESTVEIIHKITRESIEDSETEKPVISSFCPAIVRLIQVRFPAMVNLLSLFKAPLQMSAQYYRKMMVDKGVDNKDIGVFYITPCAAKIADIKSYNHDNVISGVINMNVIYNKIAQLLSSQKYDSCFVSHHSPLALNQRSLVWTLTHGEADTYPGRCLSVDEIHNVIEFLEKLENEEIQAPDFLELRACDQSCAGGVLTSENRFLAAEKLTKRADNAKYYPEQINEKLKQIDVYKEYLISLSKTDKVMPNSMYKFDDDFKTAMKKYKDFKSIEQDLPQVDCGVCGSPSCAALAEDIVRGYADIEQCVFVQKSKEISRNSDKTEVQNVFNKIWGKDKTNYKNIEK